MNTPSETKVAVITHGCRLNQAESHGMERQLTDLGYQLGSRTDADICIFNTCTVTEEADREVLREIRSMHTARPDCRIVITGCLATRDPKQMAAMPGVHAVVSNFDKQNLAAGLASEAAGVEPEIQPDADQSYHRVRPEYAEGLEAVSSSSRTRAYLKIQDGCDYRCSFCIVPHIRGRNRSIPLATARSRCLALLAEGTPEIVLTGIHLGTYGRDLSPKIRFEDLLENLLDVTRDRARLRFGSLDPHEVSDRLLDIMSAHAPWLARSLHLPLQSGDSELLKRMHRAHTSVGFEALVSRAVDAIEGVAIGADVIVGHPGETETSFEKSIRLLESLPIAYLHVFRFAPRSGTQAAEDPDQVPPAEKVARSETLRKLSARKWKAFVQSQMGKVVPGVGLRTRKPSETQRVLTDNYINVDVLGDVPQGALCEVRITGYRNGKVEGSIE